MGANAGPDIVSDGLVLALDAADNNSFRGEPTTNVVTNAPPAAGWNTANSQGSTITRSFLTEDGIPFMRFDNVVNGSDYPRVTDSVFANSATITGTFSTSLEARGTPDAQLRLRIYENGSTKITNTVTLTEEWVRYTFENQSTGFALNQPYFNPVTTGATYDIRNIQIEAKPVATRFTTGTRGTTVATGGGWADISGNSNHGEILNGTSTSNDNTVLGALDFDGTNDYIDFGTDITISPANQGWAAVYVFNTDDATTLQHFNSAENDEFNANWLALLSSYLAVWDRTQNTWRYGSTQFSSNTWYHIAFVQESGTSMQFYVNGVPEGGNHTSFSWSSSKSALITRYVGRYEYAGSYGRYFNGKIPIVQMYNRALTAQEILQNYNAFKTRFGL